MKISNWKWRGSNAKRSKPFVAKSPPGNWANYGRDSKMKLILTAAALLSLAFVADAVLSRAKAYDATYRYGNGDVLRQSCYRGAYGLQCREWWNGAGNSAQIVNVPTNMEFNTNPNWGRGCRSCADVSK
jgi:hypothetical protein